MAQLGQKSMSQGMSVSGASDGFCTDDEDAAAGADNTATAEAVDAAAGNAREDAAEASLQA